MFLFRQKHRQVIRKRPTGDPLVRFLSQGSMVTNLTGGGDVSYESESEDCAGGGAGRFA